MGRMGVDAYPGMDRRERRSANDVVSASQPIIAWEGPRRFSAARPSAVGAREAHLYLRRGTYWRTD